MSGQSFTPKQLSLLLGQFAQAGNNSIPAQWLKDGTIESVKIKNGTIEWVKLKSSSIYGALDSRYVKLVTPTGTYINFDGTTDNKVAFGHVDTEGLALGDIAGGNYTLIESDGTLVAKGDAVAWDDLRFPATGINPPGAASDPTRNTTTGLLEFSDSATNIIAGVAQLPHTWKLESTLKPHIHWFGFTAPVGANTDVVWQLDYEVVPIGGSWDGTTLSNTLQITEAVTEDVSLISEFGDIAMTGITSVSCLIIWKLSRLGGDASDTYGSAATLAEFDIHYQIDTMGSNEEYVK